MKIETYVRKSLLLAVGSSYHRIWGELNGRLQRDELSVLQGMILVSLFFEEDRPARPSVLAETLRTSRGNVSHCLSRLEKRKLIHRALSARDARSYEIILRPEGKRLALRLIKTIDELEARFERRFGRDHVLATVDRLRAYELAES